jgi:hypothetical protein
MVLKRFTYENGLDIIAPLKCGTRWLEEKTNPIKIEELWLPTNKIQRITKDTYWVYRVGREHLVSALKTEIRGAIEFNNGDVNQIISSFLNGTAGHWSPIIFEFMYSYWNRIEFNLIELNYLSNLFPGIPYDPNNYNMNYYHKSTDATSTIIEMVNTDSLNELYSMVENDKPYLTKMLNGERIPIKLI